MQAMILAAGLGSRLLPHTLVKPKPLFPVLNTPLLLLLVRRLQRLGFDYILVNCYHLHEQIEDALRDIAGVRVIVEDMPLETGGGLRNARQYMRDEPLLVTNGDIYHTIDLAKFYQDFAGSEQLVTLAVHDYPKFNTVAVSGNQVVGFDCQETGAKNLAFTGIHLIDPHILQGIVPGDKSSIINLYREMIAAGRAVHYTRVDGAFWTDIGTPDAYLALHEGLLTGSIPAWRELQWSGEPTVIHPEARLTGASRCQSWCSLGRIQAEAVSFDGVVAWDDVVLHKGECYANCILSPAVEQRTS